MSVFGRGSIRIITVLQSGKETSLGGNKTGLCLSQQSCLNAGGEFGLHGLRQITAEKAGNGFGRQSFR